MIGCVKMLMQIKGLKKVLKDRNSAITISMQDAVLEDGQIIAVVGKNGSGKTTLLRLVSGSITPDRASINLPQPMLPIIDPDRQLFGSNNLVENILLMSTLFSGKTPSNSHCRSVLKTVGLEAYVESTPRVLSRGQKIRFYIALLKTCLWRTVIWDEPTLGLDDDGRGLLISTIKTFSRSGAIFIFTTHDQSFIESVSASILAAKAPGHFEFVDVLPEQVLEGKSRIQVLYTDTTSAFVNEDELIRLIKTEIKNVRKIEFHW
jgi:ABC-2 type transport system ATP-binding protein